MEILEFNAENLAYALSNDWTGPDIIPTKHHFEYYLNYLGEKGLQARSIVIEENYISKDFLHDHAMYYVLCFQNYSKFCKRVHFFSEVFDQEELNAHILNLEESPFWDSYLGFTVVRPIPYTVIGYTVLRTYAENDEAGDRKYWGLRKYRVHFYGRELELDSLAFQEQDSILAACATSAVWSSLNKASIDFSTTLKVPSEITKDAAKLQTDGNRLFPNKGLTIPQISQAIHISGLAPEVRGATTVQNDPLGTPTDLVDSEFVKKIVNAYQHIGIPIIMGIKVPMEGINGPEYGYHAVAVLGHKIAPPNTEEASNTLWRANRITKLYIHDDQHGPFARAKFLDNNEFQTPWTDIHSLDFPSYVKFLVIPVYPKIRIAYEDIESIVIGVYSILDRLFSGNLVQQWDICLKFSEDYKKDILKSNLDPIEKLAIVDMSLPKYVWVASLFSGETKIMEFVFDATGVKSAMIALKLNTFLQQDVRDFIKQYISDNTPELQYLFGASGIKYIEFLLENL